MSYNPFHKETIDLIYRSLGKLLIDIKNDIEPTASTELLNQINLAIEIHKKLFLDFEAAIIEIQKIAIKRWHFFYEDGRHKRRGDWHFRQEVESSIINPEESEHYRNLLVILNDIAEKLKHEKFDESLTKIIEVLKFYHHLPIEWKGLIFDVAEFRREFNKLTDKLPDKLINSDYQKYQKLVANGSTAKEIIKIAEKDGKEKHEIFPLIRTLFDLSIEETANQIRVFVK